MVRKAFGTVLWKSTLGSPTETVGSPILQSGLGSREGRVTGGWPGPEELCVSVLFQSVQHIYLPNSLGPHVRFQVVKPFNCCLK